MMNLDKWKRILYQPCVPLGDNNTRITGCQRHINLSREAAREGSVLLKNDEQLLPFKNGTKVAIFGKAQIDYVKGGGGSGDVFCEYVRNIYEGLKSKVGINVFDALSLYYQAYVEEAYKNGGINGMLEECEIPSELLKSAKEFADVAIITICRYSEEEYDRYGDGQDPYFQLSEAELKMVDIVCSNFEKVVVLLNTGAMIDTSWFADNSKIQSALMIWQGGMEGALAAADILVGEVTPSGKLVDTCAKSLGDYPSSAGFHESEEYVKYTEDIFVGYRYFETIPNKKDCVVYPFGFGMSYTEFDIKNIDACQLNNQIIVNFTVENTGKYSGKEVVQLYYSTPSKKIDNPARQLCAFAKTKLLAPGESQNILLSFDICDMASYDDVGIIMKSAFVMEGGAYHFYAGKNVRDAKQINFQYILDEDKICKQCHPYCTPTRLEERMTSTGEYTHVITEERKTEEFPQTGSYELTIPEEDSQIKKLFDVYTGSVSLDEFVTQLTDRELFKLLIGQPSVGVTDTCGMGNLSKYGIPAPMSTDGPAGFRIAQRTRLTTTAFPVASMLAATWNCDLVEQIGIAGALEVKENNISIWLTPALNIHRNPLCGRNFEYYSEDPYLSGKMAASMVRGVQSQHIAAVPKHFVCNNKETNRKHSDSIVSERALREIYLRGFEICIKEAKPKLIMTSYNLLNGIHTSDNAELLAGILRQEWGFDGVVITDWGNVGDRTQEIRAGNDIHMPRPMDKGKDINPDTFEIQNTRQELVNCAKRLLNLILWLE